MIGLIGISHHNAPLGVRERFAMDEPQVAAFCQAVRKDRPQAELVVLSTCNRLEITWHLPEAGDAGAAGAARGEGLLLRRLAACSGAGGDLRQLFYAHQDRAAVTHLFRVAAGLDSMALGENQILGQVKGAYRVGTALGCTGTVLNRLFHKAFEAGKRIRTETTLNQGAGSIGYAAVELAGRMLGGGDSRLEEHPVLLIGAGEAGEMVLRSLAERGSRRILVANRTYERGVKLAGQYRARPVRLEELEQALAEVDIVIASTASPVPLVGAGTVRRVMETRRRRPMLLVDLSVPRGIEEEVREIDGVRLAGFDELQQTVLVNRERRAGEVEKAEAIVQACAGEFFSWLATLHLNPTIHSLQEKLQLIAAEELESLKWRIPEESHRYLTEFADFLQGKYLGLLVRNLKDLCLDGRQEETVELINQLFELRGSCR